MAAGGPNGCTPPYSPIPWMHWGWPPGTANSSTRYPQWCWPGLNAMSMFGLHRRLLGAIVGHLAAFEMTSSLPNRLYGSGLRRLGFSGAATRFFDEHVQADAVHEQIAGRDLAGSLAADDPVQVPQILFGAAACLLLDDLAGRHMLSHFRAGTSPRHRAAMLLDAGTAS